MNTTLYIKKNLISRIQSSNDLNFLKALQTIFDSSEQELFKLNQSQKESIEASRQDFINGKHKTNEQVMREMDVWLKNE